MARAFVQEAQAVLCVPVALGHHQGRTLRFHSENARLVREPVVTTQAFKKVVIFLCMFNSGNGAGRHDRCREFKPPAEWRHVHGRGRSCFPAAQLHFGGCHALPTHRKVKDRLWRDEQETRNLGDRRYLEILCLVQVCDLCVHL